MTVRVLVVDDAPDLRSALQRIIDRQPGWSVVASAGDGAEAIDVARDTQPDLVLLDIAMPVLDGLEALPLVREAAPMATVVMLTGFPSSVAREQAMSNGAAAYLEKEDLATGLIPQLRQALDQFG